MLVDSETTTLEKALAPLMTIGAFCNLAMFEYPLGQSRTYITCLYGLAKWSLLIYYFYYPNYIIGFEKKIYTLVIISLITIILIPINICRFKVKIINETVAILHKLSSYNLDEDLRKQIWQFMLQIKQREVKFCLGNFYFGYNFICWVCLILNKSIKMPQKKRPRGKRGGWRVHLKKLQQELLTGGNFNPSEHWEEELGGSEKVTVVASTPPASLAESESTEEKTVSRELAVSALPPP
ncbi:hypothetical protein ALC57_02497 [Trachymyrmex cornetzi]|uniref:Uncharacterized protein n=1 Tax=Trachymyrmex cornetzi TaxID=471704 RepID=A0A195EIR8_9HYME|nr:hypothetical protein ALC57_02497 [Trachymyrmex cornetzi]